MSAGLWYDGRMNKNDYARDANGKFFHVKTRISENGPPPDPEGDRLTANAVRHFGVDKRYASRGTLPVGVQREEPPAPPSGSISTKQAPPWRRKGV